MGASAIARVRPKPQTHTLPNFDLVLGLDLGLGADVTLPHLGAGLLVATAGALMRVHGAAALLGLVAAGAVLITGHTSRSNGVFHTASRPSERSHSRIDLQTNGKEYQEKMFLSMASRPKTKKVVRF